MLAKLTQLSSVLRKPAEDRSLKEKLVISSALTSLDYAVNLFFRIGSTLIVTRLLSPEIFGVFAIIMTFQVILVMVTDFGVRGLIIVSDESKDPDFLRTCWSVQVVRGICVYGTLLVLAGGLFGLQQAGLVPSETVYTAPELPFALAASGFYLVLQSAMSVNMFVYEKQMRFRLVTIMRMIRSATSPLVTIAIALVWPSVWALVIASIATGLLELVLSFRLFQGPAMRFCWHRAYARELYNRGKWIVSHSFLSVVTTSADKLMLSGFMPPAIIGVYFLATQFVELVNSLIQRLHTSIGLQFFSEMIAIEDRREARAKYYRFRVPFDLLAFVMAGGMLTAGPAVIDIIYDPRYLYAGTIMQILAIGLPLNAYNLIRNAFNAQKRFKLMTAISLIQMVTMWTGLIVTLAILDNMVAAFVVIALHRLPEMLVLLWMANRDGWIDILREVRFVPVMALGALAGWGLDWLWTAYQA